MFWGESNRACVLRSFWRYVLVGERGEACVLVGTWGSMRLVGESMRACVLAGGEHPFWQGESMQVDFGGGKMWEHAFWQVESQAGVLVGK